MAGAASLVVLMNGTLAAELRRSSRGELALIYRDEYADSAAAVPLSLAMPLDGTRFGDRATRMWIASLLPDNDGVLARWRRSDGVSDEFGLLATRLGYDCAGAVQFCRPERLTELANRSSGVTPLTDEEVAAEVAAMALDPLRWTNEGVEPYYSLGGYHNKAAFVRHNGGWARPYGSTPTSHILKPSHHASPAEAVAEHLCADAARRVGIDAVRSTVEMYGEHPALVVERFDREATDGRLTRRHQEDLCQALGRTGRLRRENEGGPGISAVKDLIENHSTDPDADTGKFADGLLWALITINRDAHARNYSLLLSHDEVRLAPLYDLNTSLAYDNIAGLGEREMAMRYGSAFTVYSAASSHSLIDTASRLSLPAHKVIDRCEELNEQLVGSFTDSIAALPDAAEHPLQSERLIDRLRVRNEAIAKTITSNRQRASRSRPAAKTLNEGRGSPPAAATSLGRPAGT